jgi:hypothetical protein
VSFVAKTQLFALLTNAIAIKVLIMKKLLFLLALVGSLGSTLAAQVKLQPYEDIDAYSIYSKLIMNERSVTVSKANKLVIQTQTTTEDLPRSCLTTVKEPRLLPVIAEFEKLTSTTWLLQRDFDLSFSYEMVSELEINGLIKERRPEQWESFYSKYPDSAGSYIFMSPIAFNKGRTLAILYFGHWCGQTCGEGAVRLLEKKDGKWEDGRLGGQGCHWIS